MSSSLHATRADDYAASLSKQKPGSSLNSERERVEQLLARKYRIDRFTVYPLYRLVTRLRGLSRTNEAPVALEITPK